ncbi:MAG: hypothetical protein ACLUVC_02445 [Longibaculum sp.]
MQRVIDIEEFDNIIENKIIGKPQKMTRCIFEFFGKNNIIYFDKNIRLDDTSIRIYGDNNVVFLSSSQANPLKIKLDIYNNSIFYIGKDCNTTRPLHVVLSEGKHLLIGNECLFSLDIWFRNADPHLIYDSNSKRRINDSKSIYVGDHVWIGQNVLISKGTQIGSGSIIGAKSLTSTTLIPSNCSVGGVPAKIIKTDLFWLKPSVHAYCEEQTKASLYCQNTKYIYQKKGVQLQFNKIETELENLKSSEERYNYLYNSIYLNNNKNRFYIEKKKSKFKKIMFFLVRKG